MRVHGGNGKNLDQVRGGVAGKHWLSKTVYDFLWKDSLVSLLSSSFIGRWLLTFIHSVFVIDLSDLFLI